MSRMEPRKTSLNHPDVLPSDPQSIPLDRSDEIAELKARILKQSRLIDSLFRRVAKMERERSK